MVSAIEMELAVGNSSPQTHQYPHSGIIARVSCMDHVQVPTKRCMTEADGPLPAPMWPFVMFLSTPAFPQYLSSLALSSVLLWGPQSGLAQGIGARKARPEEAEKSIESRSQNVRTGTAVAQMRPDAIPARHPAQGLCLPHRFAPKAAHSSFGAMLASPAGLAGQGCSAAFVPARPFRGCWRCLRKGDGKGPGREPGLQTLPPGFW